MRALFGGDGKSSIRASYGIFYTEFPGLAAGVMYGVPPFGYNYLSPAPPLLATPFITAATGVNNGQRFPFPFPPHNVSQSNPDTSINWANFAPLAADPFFNYRNRAPYIHNYMFSIQRQLTCKRFIDDELCWQPGTPHPRRRSMQPGQSRSMPEPRRLRSIRRGQQLYQRIRPDDLWNPHPRHKTPTERPSLQAKTTAKILFQSTVANSNYNALETTLRYQRNGSQFLLSYAYAKSIDQGSNLGEQIDPSEPKQTRTISAWDQKHTFVASYTLALPVGAACTDPTASPMIGASREQHASPPAFP